MPVTTSLGSYWKLDESSGNPADSAGSNTLTNNNTVGFAAGLINNAADFGTANTDKYFSVASNIGVSSEVTISFWIKLRTEVPSGQYDLLQLEIASGHKFYSIYYEYNAGTRRLSVDRGRRGVNDNVASYNVTLGTTAWYHVVATYDATDLKLYVNGVERATLATSGNGTSGGTNGITIGTGTGAGGNFTNAYIDEVGVWARALTAAEIYNVLYNGGAGTAYSLLDTSKGGFMGFLM